LREKGLSGTRRLVVHLGGFSPHKNLGMLAEVFAGLARRPEFADVDLVFAGDDANETFVTEIGRLRRQVADLGLEGRVVFTGFLPDEELVVLLNLATVLVLPSLNEGFGLPAMEAAACGCPVIATSVSPLPQILGNAARYVDPRQPRELARELSEVLSDPGTRRRMRAEGLLAAGRHDWRTPARQLAELLRRVPGHR
jgi:glycosyltransferase involved in cell wall biosynthesis